MALVGNARQTSAFEVAGGMSTSSAQGFDSAAWMPGRFTPIKAANPDKDNPGWYRRNVYQGVPPQGAAFSPTLADYGDGKKPTYGRASDAEGADRRLEGRQGDLQRLRLHGPETGRARADGIRRARRRRAAVRAQLDPLQRRHAQPNRAGVRGQDLRGRGQRHEAALVRVERLPGAGLAGPVGRADRQDEALHPPDQEDQRLPLVLLHERRRQRRQGPGDLQLGRQRPGGGRRRSRSPDQDHPFESDRRRLDPGPRRGRVRRERVAQDLPEVRERPRTRRIDFRPGWPMGPPPAPGSA